MARKSKKAYIPKSPPLLSQALAATDLRVRNPGVGKYVAYQGMLGYGTVAFGDKQNNASAPLIVPPGFATQVPYNTAINSTIIQNTSAIPVTTFYQVLLGDPIVYQCMLYMITSIIARIGDYCNPDKECEELVRRTLKRIGKIKLCQALLTSMWAGFASIKLNWGTYDQDGTFNPYIDEEGYTAIKSILVLPPDSVMLAVTPEGELDPDFGVMQYYYNLNSEWSQNGKAFSIYGNAPFAAFGGFMSPQRQVSFNPMFLSAIPEEWRIHHVFNPIGLAGNWWGSSMIQPIFSDVVDKNNTKMKTQIAVTYKAAPMVMFKTDTQTQVEINTNGDTISMAENVRRTLADGAATGYYIIEGMGAVEHVVIDNTAKIDELVKLMEYYNDNIRAGLCTPNITGNEGSFANASANGDANDEIINNITLHTMASLDATVVKILDNGIGGKIKDYGHFELRDNSLNDKAIWAKVLEGGKNLGVIDPNSLDDCNFLRGKIGLPPVTELTQDLIHGMMGLMGMGPSKGTNITKQKELIKEPYSGGIAKSAKNHYDK